MAQLIKGERLVQGDGGHPRPSSTMELGQSTLADLGIEKKPVWLRRQGENQGKVLSA